MKDIPINDLLTLLRDAEIAVSAAAYLRQYERDYARGVAERIRRMRAQLEDLREESVQARKTVSNETIAPTNGVGVERPVIVTGVPGGSVAEPPEIAAATAGSGAMTTPRNASAIPIGNSTSPPCLATGAGVVPPEPSTLIAGLPESNS